jgi:hypothetical protein
MVHENRNYMSQGQCGRRMTAAGSGGLFNGKFGDVDRLAMHGGGETHGFGSK